MFNEWPEVCQGFYRCHIGGFPSTPLRGCPRWSGMSVGNQTGCEGKKEGRKNHRECCR